jgi:hypothetical protein
VRSAVIALVAVWAGLPTADALAADTTKPTVAPVVAAPSYQLTNCGGWCAFRDVVAPANQSLVVALRGTPTGAAPPLSKARLVLQGGNHDAVVTLNGTIVTSPLSVRIEAGNKLSPDKWQGSLLIDPTNGADEVAVPVTIDVRNGPLAPLLVLVGSVALGFLITWVLGAVPKVKFTRDMRDARAKILSRPASEKGILIDLWQETWELRGSDFSTAAAHLKSLQSGMTALDTARDVQDNALRSPTALALGPWVQRIGSATAAVVQAVRAYATDYASATALVKATADQLEEAEAAKQTVDDLQQRARAATSDRDLYRAFQAAAQAVSSALHGVSPDPKQDPPDLDELVAELQATFRALEAAHGSALRAVAAGVVRPAGIGETVSTVADALGWPAPSSVAPQSRFDIAAAAAGALSPAASTSVVVVLLAVGFKITYLDNMTFGATLGDWLALVFWGLAAWGTRKTLTGLAAPSNT